MSGAKVYVFCICVKQWSLGTGYINRLDFADNCKVKNGIAYESLKMRNLVGRKSLNCA